MNIIPYESESFATFDLHIMIIIFRYTYQDANINTKVLKWNKRLFSKISLDYVMSLIDYCTSKFY